MAHLLSALERIGSPHLLVLGDIILDRYTWGDAERVSPEAPVLVLRADQEEVRLGGAASVAGLLGALECQVTLAGVVGEDSPGRVLRKILEDYQIDQSLVLADSGRPTTTKERFLGRAANRHPQQILRVDRELRIPLTTQLQEILVASVLERISEFQAVLISDYAKGTCTPNLLAAVIAAANQQDVPVLIDPGRIPDYKAYCGASLVAPNRLEAELAARMPVRSPADAILTGQRISEEYEIDAVLVKLDCEGMALVRRDQPARHFPTRQRQVYDVTGAGDMVLAMVGLCRASAIPWEESIPLANIAAGLEVERLGVAPISRAEIRDELTQSDGTAADSQMPGKIVGVEDLLFALESHRRRGKTIVFTNGCFDLLHAGHAAYLAEAAQLGDVLVVAVNSDAGVRRLKGAGRPVIPDADRAALLAALACVDFVIVFDEPTPHELLRQIKPHVLVKGGTYTVDEVVGKELVEAYGGKVRVVGRRDGVSTSSIVAAMVAART